MTLDKIILYLILLIYLSVALIIFIYILLNKKQKNKRLKMIKCPDCGKKISINAKICRHCNSEILQNKDVLNESIITNEKKSDYIKKKIILIIYQLIAGIVIVIGFEKIDDMITQLVLLLSLIINTISLIIFMIKNNAQRKSINIRFSIISLLAIICGLFFSAIYTLSFINKVSLGYDSEIREILYLETYNKKEAEQFLQNIYTALNSEENLEAGFCLSLYGIWEDREKENTYVANIEETCYYDTTLSPNALKIEVNKQDKTKIEKIYWEFNNDIDIVLYENNKQVDDFKYLYNVMLNYFKPPYSIQEFFENDVKKYLKSPSSAIFTYDNIYYLENENRFYYDGWVEAQNSFGAMVKENFELKLIPCDNDYCLDSLDYEWQFK